MEYLIGIVPPKEIEENVCKLREKWGYNATDPHITIKTPERLGNINSWLENVEKIIFDFKAFDVSIGNVGFFNQSVLFYEVFSNEIKKLHKKLVRAIHPFNNNFISSFELDNYIPHLTIMKHKTGFEELPLQDIGNEAKQLIWVNSTFTTNFVRIYSRHSNKENFHKYLDVYFS